VRHEWTHTVRRRVDFDDLNGQRIPRGDHGQTHLEIDGPHTAPNLEYIALSDRSVGLEEVRSQVNVKEVPGEA
jgi:hypothetical protein